MHKKGYTTWWQEGGGQLIPKNHPINEALGAAYRKATREYGWDGYIPMAGESGIYNFYIKEDVSNGAALTPQPPGEPP
jgi:hypothetical protein